MMQTTHPALFRLRVAYVKQGRLAYLGHLEVLHTIERIIRRAGLPYAVTQGFSPHMRIGFSSALPVGTASDAEYFDVFLTQAVPVQEALSRLQASAPRDLAPYRAVYIDVRRPALTAEIVRATYGIELSVSPSIRAEHLSEAMGVLKRQGTIAYKRGKKDKVLDLERTLCDWEISELPDCLYLRLDTAMDNEGALRPEILLAALDRMLVDYDPDESIQSSGIQNLVGILRYRVRRCSQALLAEDGRLLDPLPHTDSRDVPRCVHDLCQSCE